MIPMGNIPPAVEALFKVFQAIGKIFKFLTKPAVQLGLAVAQGVMAHKQAMKAKRTGAEILLQKYGTGAGMPVIYGTRRVAGTVVYMNTTNNKELFVVYAIAGHEIDSFDLESLQIDGRTIKDLNIYRQGYDISDGTTRINYRPSGETRTSGTFWGNTSAERANITGGAGTGDNARMTFNCHKGTTTQSADPMLEGIISEWTSNHKLSGIAYIACNYEYDIQGMFTGIPNLTVVVNGKKVYDPRTATTGFSSNPALCLLDYLTDDEYGKGLDINNDIDTASFSTSANDCDVSADTITHSSVVVENANTNTDILRIANANEDDFNNFKIGNTYTVTDGVTTYVSAKKLIDKDVTEIDIDGTNAKALLKLRFEDGAVGTAISSNTTCTFTETQIRFDCNGVLDTDETVLENTKLLVANMRGIFTYTNGKYSIKVEGTESSVVSLDEDDILESGITLSLENKEAKYNRVEAEFYNAQKKYETDTTYYTGESGDDFLGDDGDELLETRIQLPFCTNQRIAYNHAKAMLKRSRSQKTISFVATPKILQAKVGEVVSITNSNLNLSSEQYRITNMVINPDLNISVNAIEYQSAVYGYVTPDNEVIGIGQDPVIGNRVEAPTNLSFTNKQTDGEPAKLTWTDSTKYPSYEFRVQILDGLKVRYDRRVKDTYFYLDGITLKSGYVAKVSAINALGVESDTTDYNFNVTTAPITTVDIGQGSIGGFNFNATKMYYGAGNFDNTDTSVYFDSAGQFSLKDKLSWNGTTLDISGNLTVENTITADKIVLDGNNLDDLISSSGSGTGGTFITNTKIAQYKWIDGLSNIHYGLFIDNTPTQGKLGIGTASNPDNALHIYNSAPIIKLQDADDSAYVRIKGDSHNLILEADPTNTLANSYFSVEVDDSEQLNITSSVATFSNDVIVTGDLTVNGTTTTLNTATLDVEDKNITLNYGAGDTSASANGAGITIQDAVNSTTDATILWDATNDEFDFSHGINVSGAIDISGTDFITSGRSIVNAGNITQSGGFTQNAGSTVNSTYIYSTVSTGQPAFVVADNASGSQTRSGLLKYYGSATNVSLFGQTIGGKVALLATGTNVGGLLLGTGSTANAPVYIGTNGTLALTIDTSQNATFEGTVLADRIQLGTASTSYIENVVGQSTDVFNFQTQHGNIYIGSQNTSYAHFYTDRPIFYFSKTIMAGSNIVTSYNGDFLLRRTNNSNHQLTIGSSTITSSLPLSVTGAITSSGLVTADELSVTNDATFNGGIEINGDASFGDNEKIRFGASADLQIYHDGSNSYIKDVGTGNLRVDATNFYVRNSTGTELKIGAIDDGAVDLYYDGSKKFRTTSTGIDIDGEITADTGSAAAIPLTIGGITSTNYTLQRWVTSAHSGSTAYMIAYGASHSSEANHFAMKNVKSGGEIFFELFGVEPLRLTSTGATFAGTISSGAITSTSTISTGSFTLPNSSGTAGQVLRYPSSGSTLVWEDDNSGLISAITNFSDNRVLTASGSDSINGEANLTFDGSTLVVTGDVRAQDVNLTGSIQNTSVPAEASVKINENGYADGTTYFRDLDIYDGKGNQFVKFDGSTQRVGIGIIAPVYALDLGTDPSTFRLVSENGGTAIRLGAGSSGSDVVILRIDGQTTYHNGTSDSGNYGFSLKYFGTGTGNANRFGFLADNQEATQVEAYSILQDGKMGINNTSPSARLQIEEYGIDTTETSTSATTQVAVDTFASATFRSARYTVQVTNSTDSTYHMTEILLIHDGTTPSITEYGTIFTGASAEATFDADISTGNVRLLATPASTDSMEFKVVRHCITT